VVEKKQAHTCGLILLLLLAWNPPARAQSDTTGKKLKVPKHYFTPTFFVDFYSTAQKDLVTPSIKPVNLPVANQLKTYQYSQSVGGFYFPLSTKEKIHPDQHVSNWHILGTGSYMLAMPRFEGISDHTLMKASLGLRAIYNSGKKGIWFFDATPFMAGDLSVSGTMVARWASTVLYDRIVEPGFSFRVGFTRTFILGNRYHLPYLGARIGRLNRTYLSIQFPRFITLSFPMGMKARGSFYTKANGGLLAMGNTDSLYRGVNAQGDVAKTIIFGRYEGNTGFRLDLNPSSHVSIFGAIGFTGVRGIALFSEQYNAQNNEVLLPFYAQRIQKALYINFGLTVRIGRAKSVYDNHNMYEVFNANSSIDVGDNNTNTGDGNIPNQTKKKRTITNLQTKDISDLVEAQDLY
jgi:hypothetical protein